MGHMMVTMVTGYKLSQLNLPGPLKTLYNYWTSKLVGVAVTAALLSVVGVAVTAGIGLLCLAW